MRIRRLVTDDAAAYREIRLRMLREHPEAFSVDAADFESLGFVAYGREPGGIKVGAHLEDIVEMSLPL